MAEDEAQVRNRTERLAQLGNLLAGFAHEVRNPLSTIGLNLQLVLEEFEQAESARDKRTYKRLAVVEEEVKRLRSILEEFLRFARSPELKLQVAELNGLLQGLVDFMAPEMREKGIALRFYPEGGSVHSRVDRDQIRAAVLNLLRNALDACRPGDQVLVSLRREGDEAVVRVTDTGVGMTAEVQARGFQPYFSTKKDGTGLGLPTVRRIVEDHGGRVELTSEVGKGTQFSIRLPLQRGEQEGA
jgi:signal transduction histidine kinase